jgi:hypothetical protein
MKKTKRKKFQRLWINYNSRDQQDHEDQQQDPFYIL